MMPLLLFKIAFICFFSVVVNAARNKDICTIPTESSGLIPPPLPRNLEHKGELADLLNKTLLWQELYFDNVNSRGKLVLLYDKVEFHFIADYTVEQIVQYMVIHPGATLERDPQSEACIAYPMQTSDKRYIFGYKETNEEGIKSRMYDAYEMMRYGGKYLFAANGTVNLEDRGLKANVFSGCVYDAEYDATMASTFYFSDLKTSMAAATLGFDDDFMSVPVQIDLYGVYPLKQKEGPPLNMTWNTQQSLSWFAGNPQFGMDTFNIPQGLYCENYKGRKSFPFFPTRFSTRIEETTFNQDENGNMITGEILMNHEIWYDVENNLARRDFMPVQEQNKEIRDKFNTMSYVKTIYDFNTGIVYTINKASGRCFARVIRNGDYFETSKEDLDLRMGSPEEIFMMERDTLEYKGQDFVRDINTDVWAGKYLNKDLNMTLYLESFISTNGFFEEVDEEVGYRVPVRHVIYADRMERNQSTQTVTQMNFFKFKPTPPFLLAFNLFSSACLDNVGREYLGIKLSITDEDWDTTIKYIFSAREAAQSYIANVSKVATPLRIQGVNIRNIANSKMIIFTLLNHTKLDTRTLIAQKGATIDVAIENLRQQIDGGNFFVKFQIPGTTTEQLIMGQPKGFVRFRVPVEGTPYHTEPDLAAFSYIPISPETLTYSRQRFEVEESKVVIMRAPEKVKEVKGMSPGGLAGLAIGMLFIGIGVGICVMYLYISKYGNGRNQDHAMHAIHGKS